MPVTLDPVAAALPVASPAGGPGPVTSRAMLALGRKLDTHDPAVVRDTAARLASELFFAPLLERMREFPFGRELATGGQTESIFGQQLDQRVADTVAAGQPGLLRQIVRTLTGGRAAPATEQATWSVQQQMSRVRAEGDS